MPKRTAVYNTMSQDFTTVESYHGDSHFSLHLDDCQVDSRTVVAAIAEPGLPTQ